MYSAWATKQRSKILFGLASIGFVILAAYITIGMYRPPSCFDKKLNQDEIAVDCGGTCSLMCASQIKPLNTVWARSIQVSPTLWSAVAYVENPNTTGKVNEARYRFTVYNRNNEIIVERENSIFITQGGIVPVFEGRIELLNQVPYRTEFEWIEPLVWTQMRSLYTVAVEEQELSNSATQPEITAVLVNKEPFPLVDVEVVAIVFDVNNNAVGVSKTFVDRISARGKRNITFSWTSPFTAPAERWQLIVRVPTQDS
ncbi:MAG: hypothetical protein UV60_C0032G0013 [Parcubacteria group bacterium GW2011_GWA2_43_11]|nr:MAG: hypothetical protein UV60_C0032G0013 [Parcubacteria group bacterium GW2011_GWA2_43_11]